MSSQWMERRDAHLNQHIHHLGEARKHLNRTREVIRNTLIIGVGGATLTALSLLAEARIDEPTMVEVGTLFGGSLITISSMITYGVPNVIHSTTKAMEHSEYAVGHKAAAVGHTVMGQAAEAARSRFPRGKV